MDRICPVIRNWRFFLPHEPPFKPLESPSLPASRSTMNAASCKKSFRNCTHTHSVPRIIRPIALAGTRVMDRMTGRAAVTSHRGSGFHGPEGARQAGMPGGSATAYRRCSAPEADGAPYVPRRKWPWDVCPAECGDRHRTGAGTRKVLAVRCFGIGPGSADRPTKQLDGGRDPPVFPTTQSGQIGNEAWR